MILLCATRAIEAPGACGTIGFGYSPVNPTFNVPFEIHLPSARLAPHVEMLWAYHGPGPAHRRERVLPDGSVELVINLDDVARRRFDRRMPERFQCVRHAWVSGPQPEFMLIDVLPEANLIGAHFRPGGLAAFVRIPVEELSGQLVEADAVWNRDADDLRDMLLETPRVKARFRVLERFLMRRLRDDTGDRSLIHAALPCLETADEGPAIETIAAHLGVSHKHFIHRFRSEIGLTPKRFGRIRRFQRTLQSLQAGRAPDWTDLACAGGYYDQAHLIHEFRSFGGLTPAAFLRQPGADHRFIPLADGELA